MPRNSYVLISRAELYEQVWNNPTYKVAMKYGLSDVGLAKICNRNNIPKPPLGYWAKLQYGRKAEQPELPGLENELPIKITTTSTQIGIEKILHCYGLHTERENRNAEGAVCPSATKYH